MALGVKECPISLYLIRLSYFVFKYFIINFKFLSAQHSWGMFFVFRLLYTQGSLFLEQCIAWVFLFRRMLSSFTTSFTLLLRQTMSSLTQTHCVIKNGAGWGGAVSLLISTLPGMRLSTDGGLDMAFCIILYSLRKQEKWGESGENSTGAMILSLGSTSHQFWGLWLSTLQSGTYNYPYHRMA